MIKDIQKLITQITDYLSDKEGFSTETSNQGCVVKVVSPNGTDMQYDGYELLLYTLSTRKLGHDIDLNVRDTDEGKVFAINTDAELNLREYMSQVNLELTDVEDDEVLSVVLCDQTSSQPHPYCLMTMFKNGNWLRQDLTMAEILYAATHELKIEKDENAYVYTKLRVLAQKIYDEIQELN